MSTYDDRVTALEACTGGETVTVPAGWTVPAERALDSTAPRPGDVYTHDGGSDSIPWSHGRPSPVGPDRGWGFLRYVSPHRLAEFGLTVDGVELDDTEPAPRIVRLDRLEEANRGDTVTIPRGHSGIIDGSAGFLPGDVLEHDGSTGTLVWGAHPEVEGRVRRVWFRSAELAEAGLDVDGKPAADPADEDPAAEDLAAAVRTAREELTVLQESVNEANARASDAEREAIVESVHADMRHRAQALEHAHRIADGSLELVEVVMLAEWILGGDR